jgi:hypothetical protein
MALKVIADNQPHNFRLAIYTEWAVIVSAHSIPADTQGIMAIIYVLIPETPYWCAARGEHERGRKTVQFLNGGIEGYDVDFHYDLIRRAVEKEQSYQKEIDGDRGGFLTELRNVKEVLVGINGVRRRMMPR